MPSYIGEYHIKIDKQGGRIVIPNDLREEMKDHNQMIFYLLRGTRGNVLMVPSQLWEKIKKEFSNEPILNPVSQIALSYLIGGSIRVEIDSQFRMPIPGWVREHAGINDTAVIIGCGEYLELWNENNWKQFIESSDTRRFIEGLLSRLFPSRFEEEMKKFSESRVSTTHSEEDGISSPQDKEFPNKLKPEEGNLS